MLKDELIAFVNSHVHEKPAVMTEIVVAVNNGLEYGKTTRKYLTGDEASYDLVWYDCGKECEDLNCRMHTDKFDVVLSVCSIDPNTPPPLKGYFVLAHAQFMRVTGGEMSVLHLTFDRRADLTDVTLEYWHRDHARQWSGRTREELIQKIEEAAI